MAVLFFGLPILWILTIGIGFIFHTFGFDDKTSMILSGCTTGFIFFVISTGVRK
jgi:hypothetical protein